MNFSQRVWQCIRDNGTASTMRIEHRTGLARSAVHDAVYRLVAAGYIRRVQWAVYEVTGTAPPTDNRGKAKHPPKRHDCRDISGKFRVIPVVEPEPVAEHS